MQYPEMSTPTPIYALHQQHHLDLASTLGLPSTTTSSSTLQGALFLDMATNAHTNSSATPPSTSSSSSSSSSFPQLHASSASPVGSRPNTGHGQPTAFGSNPGAPSSSSNPSTKNPSSSLGRPLPSGFGLQPVIDSPLPSIPELPLSAPPHHQHHQPSPPTQLPAIHASSPSPAAVTPSSSWPPPPQHHHHQQQLQLPPPLLTSTARRQFPPALDVQPFAYSTQYSTPFDSWGGFNSNEGRRWSMSDQPSSHHVPQSAPGTYSQRPWTSSASSSSFGGTTSATTTTGGSSSGSALSHFGNSSSSSSAAHADHPNHHHHPPSSSSPSYSSDNLARPHSHHSHQSPSSYLSSRPSTTSSLSSYSSSASSHLATPHSGPLESFFGATTNGTGGLKRSTDASFYSIGGANESTDTIVGVPGGTAGGHYASANHHHHHQAADDSNPFFFARELASLQVTQERAQAASSLRRPSSSSAQPHLHPTLQSALASTSPSDAFQFYGGAGSAADQYGATPPSTGGSTGYYENSLPRPPSSGYGRPTSSSGLLLGPTSNGAGGVERHLLSANTVGSSNPHAPSPYSLIVENPDPATKQSRPHLCTHCNETFRRIHDAKRHAYGALGIKNYACMGGCGMTFKRSEGRARHWQREEVAGVGCNITIAEFFSLNPAMLGTPIGSRDGAGGVAGFGLNPQGMMIWGGKGCEIRHGLVMNGTMEEDRRLRNKARRERILMIGARTSVSGNNRKKDEEELDQRQHSPVSPTAMGSGVGPMRKQRTSYAVVSPY